MAQGLVGPNGNPISTKDYKKAAPPKLGEAFGSRWSDADFSYFQLPGGGILQFDHYQVNASLSVLTFMMHQLDWKIECDNDKIRKHCQENMAGIWTRLVRALSQSFWAGYSPSILQWENDLAGKTVQLTKIKDLVPEECRVNWKEVDGWSPPDKPKPKLKVYDGIKQFNSQWPIPTENSLWYPLLMENGDYYGRKLLRPAFTSWFFSILMHLFSNRYFERFGEPVPVGRAPYDDELDVNGKKVSGMQVMAGVLNNLRNRSTVVLPDQRSVVGTATSYDYTIEYLESQMRGADFERYMMRLDEEISLAMFTPLLMLRAGDVGSYNLGSQHSMVYMQMLNALAGDWAQYINDYILNRMVDMNFSPTSPRARIKFRKLGDEKSEMVKALLQMLFSGGKVMPDLKEMGDIAGLTLTEVEQLGNDSSEGEPGKKAPKGEDPDGSASDDDTTAGETTASSRVVASIYRRLSGQVYKAHRDGTFGDGFQPDLGYARQLTEALAAEGVDSEAAGTAHARVTGWVTDLASAGMDSFSSPDAFLRIVQNGLRAVAVGGGNASD
jgi:hypothetical protein